MKTYNPFYFVYCINEKDQVLFLPSIDFSMASTIDSVGSSNPLIITRI